MTLLKKNQISFHDNTNQINESPQQKVLRSQVPFKDHATIKKTLKSKLLKDVDDYFEKSKNEILAGNARLIEEANQLRSELSKEREKMLADVEDIKSVAKQDGFTAGHNEGKNEFEIIKQDYIKKTEDIFVAVNEFQKEKIKILKATEPEVLKLSTEIAKQILNAELTINKDSMMKIVIDALTRITDKTVVDIKVNKEDFEFLNKNKDIIRSYMDDIKNLNVKEDNNIGPGGCIIETELGVIDARIETKLAGIYELINNKYLEKNNLHTAENLNKEFEEESTEDLFGSEELTEEETNDNDELDDEFNFDDEFDDSEFSESDFKLEDDELDDKDILNI